MCLKAQEQRAISRQQRRVIVGKVKEQMKQLPLEVVTAPKWRVIVSCVNKWSRPKDTEEEQETRASQSVAAEEKEQ